MCLSTGHILYKICYNNNKSVLSVLRGGVGDEQLEKVKFVKTYENNCTKNKIHVLARATAVISNIYPLVCELPQATARMLHRLYFTYAGLCLASIL